MKETTPNKQKDISAEDRVRMERVLEETKGIFFADEILKKTSKEGKEELETEGILEKSKKILAQETDEEIILIGREFDRMFGDPESVKRVLSDFKKEFGWPESKSLAMLGVFRHALNEFFYRSHLQAADEFNPRPEGQTRDTREILSGIIADDYGAEVMRDISSLVEKYVAKIHELIKERRGEEDDGLLVE